MFYIRNCFVWEYDKRKENLVWIYDMKKKQQEYTPKFSLITPSFLKLLLYLKSHHMEEGVVYTHTHIIF